MATIGREIYGKFQIDKPIILSMKVFLRRGLKLFTSKNSKFWEFRNLSAGFVVFYLHFDSTSFFGPGTGPDRKPDVKFRPGKECPAFRPSRRKRREKKKDRNDSHRYTCVGLNLFCI